jgi:hypothetical protein
MRTKNDNRIIGHLGQFIDKNGTAIAQVVHNMTVMDHFMTDIHRATKHL